MAGSLIDLPTPSTREEWVAHVARLEGMKRENPNDESICRGIEYAERVIAELDQLNRKNAAEAE
jgi:hypothetical protein